MADDGGNLIIYAGHSNASTASRDGAIILGPISNIPKEAMRKWVDDVAAALREMHEMTYKRLLAKPPLEKRPR